MQLFDKQAPISVENFLRYVDEGFFDGTIFHRVIPGFMVQGGGLTADMKNKSGHAPIKNEATNGLKNKRGTLAMARTNDINSATSQFFINLVDNDFLDHKPGNYGYAVFGRIDSGMDVVDAIAAVKTGNKGCYQDVPTETVTIESVRRVDTKIVRRADWSSLSRIACVDSWRATARSIAVAASLALDCRSAIGARRWRCAGSIRRLPPS